MSCRSCADTEREPLLDLFSKGCMSCEARALASIGAHVESAEAGSITPRYREVLEKVFGDRWMQGHELVRKWAERITQAAARDRAKAKDPAR